MIDANWNIALEGAVKKRFKKIVLGDCIKRRSDETDKTAPLAEPKTMDAATSFTFSFSIRPEALSFNSSNITHRDLLVINHSY